jgi:hypothetical protein
MHWKTREALIVAVIVTGLLTAGLAGQSVLSGTATTAALAGVPRF